MAPLTAAIIAMLIQQSLMTMSTSAIPNLWKYIGPDFGLGDGMIACLFADGLRHWVLCLQRGG